MTGVTTHVLDSNRGRPAAGVRIDLSVMEGGAWRLVRTLTTNADGRTERPIVGPDEVKVGEYQLEFHTDDYFRGLAGADETQRFVDNAVVRFSVYDVTQHYHVPLLCTPGACTTYRGS